MEIIEAEVTFLQEQVKGLRRTASAIKRQIDEMETRIYDLRRQILYPEKKP